MIRRFVFALAALSLPACASIDRGLTDHIRVDSVPQGASASFTYIPFKPDSRNPTALNRTVCEETPCAFEVRRSQRGIVKVSEDGFESAEYYIGPSRYRGGGGVDLNVTALKTTSSSLAVGLTGGLFYAGITQFGSAITFGGYPSISSATGATAGTGVGLGIAAGSMLFDAGTEANMNVYPNPVTIGLAQTGQNAEPDPFVDAYYELMRTYQQQQTICKSRRNKDSDGLTCADARNQYRAAKKDLTNLEDERDEEIKALIKAAKEANRDD